MIKLWHWIAGAFAGLLLLLKVTLLQRDKARDDAKREREMAETQLAIRDAERRITQAQIKQRESAKQAQHELDESRGTRPTGSFGDDRLRKRQD